MYLSQTSALLQALAMWYMQYHGLVGLQDHTTNQCTTNQCTTNQRTTNQRTTNQCTISQCTTNQRTTSCVREAACIKLRRHHPRASPLPHPPHSSLPRMYLCAYAAHDAAVVPTVVTSSTCRAEGSGQDIQACDRQAVMRDSCSTVLTLLIMSGRM